MFPDRSLVEALDNTDATDGVITFTSACTGLKIRNLDTTNALVVEVNDISFTVPAKDFEEFILKDSFTTVTLSGEATTYQALGFQR